ncbi:PREDICTED: early nodulin-like protein 2 [Camelina sativa]|uniref:Early nodulin-like protein 2 n=1 Tax=Camelina sativa TaxID=90675 RepID=A0ABM0UAW8_CAMSA|nr:PREDICTED: early nodulin-like protein 2 [Camelina sativa]
MGLVRRFDFDFYLIIVMLMGLGFTMSNGYKFYVGGRDGWVLTPSEDYSLWSHRNRFQVNDTLHFKYAKGKESVLEVSEQEYNTCNTTHPLTSLSDGDSLFLLSHSGSFFFISGNSQNCLKGQKLAVKVMSTVHHSHSPRHTSPSPSPSPSLSTVHQGLSSPGPSPGLEPSSDSHTHAPAPGPALAHNSAGLFGPGVVVFVIMISSMF